MRESMAGEKGKFIVIEGTDGSGKTEQFHKLLLRLPPETRVATADFPRYGQPAAHFVENYLNKQYGENVHDIGPEAASIFYALDRFDAGHDLKTKLAKGEMIVANRYVGSNMGHQGAKIDDRKKRAEFFKWLYWLEYEIFKIPKPDLNIILHMPATMAQALVDKKGERQYLGGKGRDLHEGDISHLEKAEKVYLEMASLFPQDFTVVECCENGKLLSIDEVHEKIWVVARKTIGV
jgi:dTMP kinase